MASPYATWPLVIAQMDRVSPAQHRNETGELPWCPTLEKRVRSLGDPRNRSRNATGNRHRYRLKFASTTLWLSDLMKTLGSGSVISVDLKWPEIDFPDNVQFIEGDSIASRNVAQDQGLCGGHRAILLADGNHATEHAFQELLLYGPTVAPGCYFVVEDGVIDVPGH